MPTAPRDGPDSDGSISDVSIERCPPNGIASRALTTRFSSDLFDHPRIGANVSGCGAVRELDDNVLAKDPMQHPRQVADDDIHVDVAHLNRLTAAEREQLARERCRTLGVLRNIGDRLARDPAGSVVLRRLLRCGRGSPSGCC